MDERAVSEYVYCSHGEPLANDSGEIALARKEIVRCRDCMYFTPEREPETSGCFEILHPSFCDMHITKTEPDGFCSFSKRKEGAMTSATDNRTTELLRKLLNERGVKYEAIDAEATRYSETRWAANGAEWAYVTIGDNDPFLQVKSPLVKGVTPEQAITATLGSDDRYDAGFASGVQAVFQQLEGIEDYEELQDFIAEYWAEGEGNDER